MTRAEKNLRFWFGNKIGNTPWLFPVNYRRSQYLDKIITDETEICIEGFQRSGNSFFVALFKIANPKVKIANHTHGAAQVIRATRAKIPVVVLIRNPADAIASLITWDDKLSIGLAIDTYFEFYKKLSAYSSSMLIVNFKSLIVNPDLIIRKINQRFSCNFSETHLSSIQIDRIMNQSGLNSYDKNNAPYPNEFKKKHNAIHKERIISHRKFSKAESLYNDFLSNSEWS